MTAKILLQLDPDDQPSVFDAVVAVDAEVDQLFRHGGVEASQVRDLVYGCMFTRGGYELRNTAIFCGGSQFAAAEALFQQVQKTFFGPVRVSTMFDANGCNTTAAAAVIAAGRHLELSGATAAVLGGTGPVGQRAVRLLAKAGCRTNVVSRSFDKANSVCRTIGEKHPDAMLTPFAGVGDADLQAALQGVSIVIAAGAAGVEMLSADLRRSCHDLKVAIDLNAVPPVGLTGISPTDKAKSLDGATVYGALGVGGLKMKIHKAALRKLFTANDLVLDAEEIYDLGLQFR
ncbi:MAG: methylene-tetrahydromethanopterin dehydrogenase N-terminal domain-containing protein [Pirellulales bacterium]